MECPRPADLGVVDGPQSLFHGDRARSLSTVAPHEEAPGQLSSRVRDKEQLRESRSLSAWQKSQEALELPGSDIPWQRQGCVVDQPRPAEDQHGFWMAARQ